MAKRVPPPGDNDGNDLFGEGEDARRSGEWFTELYPLLKIAADEADEPILAYDLTAMAYFEGAWPVLEQDEANIRYRMPSATKWMDARQPTGLRTLYKTPERGRKPWEECVQIELELDLWQKVVLTGDNREQTRNDIVNYILRFKVIPKGPHGEKIPAWLWDDDDERYWLRSANPTGPQPNA